MLITSSFVEKYRQLTFSSRQLLVRILRPRTLALPTQNSKPQRILVIGICLTNKKNKAEHIFKELQSSRHHQVTQKWIVIGQGRQSNNIAGMTVLKIDKPTPKFVLLNKIIASTPLINFDLLMVIDDDVVLPRSFLDSFIAVQQLCNFSLCQPCRTHTSWTDHRIVEQVDGLIARQTRFVEIGPVFCISADLFNALLPFDETSPMGWGLDFVWPVIVEALGKTMGIIDAVPVDHSLRKPAANYDSQNARLQMNLLFAKSPHLSSKQAFSIIENYK